MSYSKDVMRLLEKRYLQPGETPEDMFWRVATNLASAEKTDAEQAYWADKFMELMCSHKFLPNSPTLMNAGTPIQQLSACFVLPVDDSIAGIFETVKNTALIHQSGGGTGFSFSALRPAGSAVKSTTGTASGPVSFIKVFDAATESIKQGGRRRGANMAMLRVDHPDILDFINTKRDFSQLNNFNLSAAVTDKFMEAVKNNGTYGFRGYTPNNGRQATTAYTRDVWDKLVESAHATGEPGIVFIDAMNRHNPTPNLGNFEATNPCGEQPLLPYESCVLGSINLVEFWEDSCTGIDYLGLEKCVETAVRFLDNAIDMNKYPLPEIEEATKLTRKIGLGVMGFADLLLKMGIPYDSLDAVDVAHEVMGFIGKGAIIASDELAKERGPYPAYVADKLHPPIRNATRTTIAPTGTIALIAGVSSGIEPIYAASHTRIMDDGRTEVQEHPFKDAGHFRTAHDIAPKWHVQMQAAFQKFTNNAVSKTINLPESASVQDVEDAFMLAHELGCKGITVYRDGSREGQILQTSDHTDGKTTNIADICPDDPHPATRPDSVHGTTRKILTGCGNLYVTINERDGAPFELFARIGKAGGCAASQTEAIGRLVSLALRKGVAPYDIQQQLTGVRCSSPAKGVCSCADGVALALDSLSKKTVFENGNSIIWTPMHKDDAEKFTGLNQKWVVTDADRQIGVCTECSSNLIFQEGCAVCRACGYSRC